MFWVLNDVDVVRINRQHWRVIVRRGEEFIVGVIQLVNVTAFHVAFVGAVTQGDALHQYFGIRPQINEQVGEGNLFGQRLVDAAIHFQFVTLQVDAGEERVFGEGVIGEQVFFRAHHFGHAAALLVIAREQKEDLRLEGVTRTVAVKIGQEWILLEHFEQNLRVECGLQQAGQCGLADADNSFNRNVHVRAPQGGMAQGYHKVRMRDEIGMYNSPMPKICIFPRVEGTGGVASFRLKFEAGLKARGIEVTHDPDNASDALLILAGTRNLLPLWRARRRGTRLVQRLDGVNWVQRVRWTGIRYTVRAEYGNLALTFIRKYFADRVVYQSQFIRTWWEDWYGAAKVPATVILNGVDLQTYTPNGAHERPADRVRILLLEGSLAGGLNRGLFHAVALAERLAEKQPVEVTVAGRVDESTQRQVARASKVTVDFLGVLPREQIPFLARSSHFLYSAEVNPPCPNSVIEALACGLPVAGFDSGSLTELVRGDAGRVVPYGGDPWKLDPPDVPALAEAVTVLLSDQPRFRQSARARAESALGVDGMVDAYLKVLLK